VRFGLSVRGELMLKTLENTVLRRISGNEREELTGE
jgi:hypothetical protein